MFLQKVNEMDGFTCSWTLNFRIFKEILSTPFLILQSACTCRKTISFISSRDARGRPSPKIHSSKPSLKGRLKCQTAWNISAGAFSLKPTPTE